jgi:type I restriction enzyme R subunit
MDREMSDLSIQEEVIKKFGERYGGMTLNDWRHIIEAYTPMVSANVKEVVPEEQAKTISMNYPIAAEE